MFNVKCAMSGSQFWRKSSAPNVSGKVIYLYKKNEQLLIVCLADAFFGSRSLYKFLD